MHPRSSDLCRGSGSFSIYELAKVALAAGLLLVLIDHLQAGLVEFLEKCVPRDRFEGWIGGSAGEVNAEQSSIFAPALCSFNRYRFPSPFLHPFPDFVVVSCAFGTVGHFVSPNKSELSGRRSVG